jgi:Na+/H+-dicarboxylate symporter/ABC-type amino acid transport substrate-binding protein
MAIASLLGIFVGLFFGEMCSVFAPWASAYVMILKITTLPYLFAAVIHGVGQLNSQQLKTIIRRGSLILGLAWAINIAVIYLTAFAFPQASGVKTASYSMQAQAPINVAELLIPANIFSDLANNVVPAIVIFSLLIGIALMYIKDKATCMSTLKTTLDALTDVTSWISRITPYGTFIILANQAGSIQIDTVKQVGTYIVLYVLGLSLVIFWIFPRLISLLTPVPMLTWLKYMLPILLLAYTTNLVIVALPYIIALVQRETHVLFPKDEKVQTQVQGIVSIVFNLPMGSLFISIFLFFISLFYGSPLGVGAQTQMLGTTFLTGLGAVGLGAWINSLSFLLDSLGLPAEAVDIYLTTVPFTAGFQSMVSAIEVTTIAFLIALACRNHIRLVWPKITRSALVTAAPILLLFLALKIFHPLPKIENLRPTIYDLSLQTAVPITVYAFGEAAPPSPPSLPGEDSFNRILRTRVLRIGYNPFVTPYCFYNRKGELVGYDIACAAELARDLECSLECVPMNYASLREDLDRDRFDIGMSAVTMNEERLQVMNFSQPYLESTLVFVTQHKDKKRFPSLEAILADPTARVAVLAGSAYEALMQKSVPRERIVLLETYDAFAQLRANTVLVWEEFEAIPWILRHPGYAIITPDPFLGVDTLAYPTKFDARRLNAYLTQWIRLKKNEAFSKAQYELWILGKTESTIPYEPRWSIIRNWLHWVD